MKNEDRNIPPKFIACRIDWSEGCNPEFLERCGGKLWLTGFFDENLVTYICSAQATTFIHALNCEPETYPEDQELSDELFSDLLEVFGESGEDDYYATSTIEALRKEDPSSFIEIDIDFDEDDDPEEVVREYLQGNPVF